MSTRYHRVLKLLISIVLLLGLTMPFIGHISKGIFYRLHGLDYICYVSPFIGLAVYLWLFMENTLEKEITKAQVSGHLVGSILYFLPYYLLGLEVRNTLKDAPQGLGILIFPLSVPIALCVVYRPIYSMVVSALQSPSKNSDSKDGLHGE